MDEYFLKHPGCFPSQLFPPLRFGNHSGVTHFNILPDPIDKPFQLHDRAPIFRDSSGGIISVAGDPDGIAHGGEPVKVIVGIYHLGVVRIRGARGLSIDVVGQARDFLERVGDACEKPPQVLSVAGGRSHWIGQRRQLFASPAASRENVVVPPPGSIRHGIFALREVVKRRSAPVITKSSQLWLLRQKNLLLMAYLLYYWKISVLDALECSLDQLVRSKDNDPEVRIRDKGELERMRLIDSLEEADRNALIYIIDSMLTKKRMRELLDGKPLQEMQ
jgi:hypothetical protein